MKKWLCGPGLWFLVSLFGSPFVLAGGGSEVGNGADAAILPDDTVILADPFIPRPNEKDIADLSLELETSLRRAGSLLSRLGAAVAVPQANEFPKLPVQPRPRIPSRSLLPRFLLDQVLNRRVLYHFPEELPEECRSSNDARPAPGGPSIQLFACTRGPVTWFKRDLFRRMSVREQTKAVIHERLHVVDIPHAYIADITDGVETVLSLYHEQINGKRPALSAAQIKRIETLIDRLVRSGLGDGKVEPDFEYIDQWRVFPNGGGLVHKNSRVSPKAYIGVGSLLYSGSMVEAYAEVINSSCYVASCELMAGARLEHSTVEPGFGEDFAVVPLTLRLGRDTVVESGTIRGSTSAGKKAHVVVIGDGARFSHSSLNGVATAQLGIDSSVDSSAILLASGAGTEVHLSVGDRARLKRLLVPTMIKRLDHAGEDITLTFPAEALLENEEAGTVCNSRSLIFLTGNLTVRELPELQSRCESF